jgi:uncharacterized protein
MPGRDGTGPSGQGPVGGRRGAGMGRGTRGSNGYCVCPKCGEKVLHQQGTPCSSLKCSKCGSGLVRGQ